MVKTICKYPVLYLLVLLAVSSCQPSKKVHKERLYLQGIDTALYSAVNIPDPVIQKGEMLAIVVYSDSKEATDQFNQIQSGGTPAKGTSTESGGGSSGYLVDLQGNILFHGLGPIHAEGLTKQQLRQLLLDKLSEFLKNPYVEIRFLNKRVTVLGEVAKPGVINMPEEKLSIIDAIALSGDITNFGRKDNILVVREENGKRTMARLNIKDPGIYRSDYFYLHRDDMVYIEPDRKKPTGTDQTLLRNLSLGATLVSTLAILYTLFKK